QEAPPRPSQVGPVPEEMDALVLQLLEKEPERRPADAAAVRREVKELTLRLGAVTKIGEQPQPPAGPAVKQVEPVSLPLSITVEPMVTAAAAAPPPAAPARWSRTLRRRAPLAAAGLVGVAVLAWLGSSRSPDPPLPETPAAPAVPETSAMQVIQEPITLAPGADPAPRPGRKTPPPSGPTREALLKRIDQLRRRVQASAPPGGSPNPMILSLLGRQDAAARAAADGPARAKVARSLDAFEHQFVQSGDLKRR